MAAETVARALAGHFPPDRQHLVEINVAALTRGAAIAARQLSGAASARVGA